LMQNLLRLSPEVHVNLNFCNLRNCLSRACPMGQCCWSTFAFFHLCSELVRMGMHRLLLVSETFSGHNPHRILTFHVVFLTSHFLLKSLSPFNLLLVCTSIVSSLLHFTTQRKKFPGHNPHKGEKTMISLLLRESKSDFAQTSLSCGATLGHYKSVEESVRRLEKIPLCGLCPVCGLCPGTMKWKLWSVGLPETHFSCSNLFRQIKTPVCREIGVTPLFRREEKSSFFLGKEGDLSYFQP
jgi:hypothetical protein